MKCCPRYVGVISTVFGQRGGAPCATTWDRFREVFNPLLERRGGRDIQEKWREASFVGADGVVAHETVSCERPPRLRVASEASRKFFDRAASPPLEEGTAGNNSVSKTRRSVFQSDFPIERCHISANNKQHNAQR